MTACLVCAIPLGFYDTCPSPDCPAYGERSGSVAMQQAALRYRGRPLSTRHTADGADALSALERRAWLELTEARGALIDIAIEHAERWP